MFRCHAVSWLPYPLLTVLTILSNTLCVCSGVITSPTCGGTCNTKLSKSETELDRDKLAESSCYINTKGLTVILCERWWKKKGKNNMIQTDCILTKKQPHTIKKKNCLELFKFLKWNIFICFWLDFLSSYYCWSGSNNSHNCLKWSKFPTWSIFIHF